MSSERAVELEPALIGALLLEPEVIAEVAAILKPADFSAPACLKTYECILALHIDGEAVDHLTVDAALRKAKFPEPTAADLTDWTADALPSHTVIAQAKKIACAKVKSS